MDDILRGKLDRRPLTTSDVLDLLAWQLSLPAEEMDCSLIDECDRFLAPNASGMSETEKAELLNALKARISNGARPPRDMQRAAFGRAPHRRITTRRAFALLLAALLLLALAVGAVAYGVHRGVLSFNEDWGWLAPLTYLDGADEFVVSGSLAHLKLDHVTIDVLEAVTDGADLRVVYSVTNNEGVQFEADAGTDYQSVPGAEEDGVHMCDWIEVNGQDAYFDDAWQAPGEKPGQILYYLQSNLPSWGVDISGAEELHIGLPMLPRPEGSRSWDTVDFTIPARMPAELIRSAELVSSRMGGHAVTVEQAVFSPLNGYVQLHIEGFTRAEFLRDFTTMGEVYGPDNYALSGADLYGTDETENGILAGFTMYPPVDGWPDTLVLALERNNYEPDWEAVVRLTAPGEIH